MEIWKNIEGYEGSYQVSDLGNVKSLSRVILKHGKYPFICKERVLKQMLKTDGYMQVTLHLNSVQSIAKVHQLVAESFLGHKRNGYEMVVNHKNFIRTDNRLENLEIVTPRENANKKHLKSTSEYTGVHWCKRDKFWIAQIFINRKTKNLGYFINEHDAHLAYESELKKNKV